MLLHALSCTLHIHDSMFWCFHRLWAAIIVSALVLNREHLSPSLQKRLTFATYQKRQVYWSFGTWELHKTDHYSGHLVLIVEVCVSKVGEERGEMFLCIAWNRWNSSEIIQMWCLSMINVMIEQRLSVWTVPLHKQKCCEWLWRGRDELVVSLLFIMQISKVLGDKRNLLREVRLIRDRGGTSKGFAFLEFYRLEDARMWLEENRVGCSERM